MKLDDDDPLFSEWSSTAPSAHPEARPGSGHAASSLAPHEIPFEALDEERPFSSASPEHRAKLQRYVTVTVAGCVALCLAAAVRVGVARVMAASEGDARPSIAAARAPEGPPSSTATAHVPAAEPAAVVAPGAAPISAHAPAPTPAPPATGALPPKTALQERELARHALERGKLRDAIAASERATAGDPTDAESWLILGAANQELGHGAAARAAFGSCVKLAKRGPIRECRAMLR